METWALYNLTGDTHPSHIHLVSFQVLGRAPILDFPQQAFRTKAMEDSHTGELRGTGATANLTKLSVGSFRSPPPEEQGWKDTVQAHSGEVTRVIARYDRPGRYVWHCHILSHEDHEMMQPYFVGPRGGCSLPKVGSQRIQRRVFEREDEGIALLSGDTTVSFRALRELIHERQQRLEALPRGVAVLRASRRLDFIANCLALLEWGFPQALFAPEWTGPEQEVRRRRLGRCFELDDDLNVVREHPEEGPLLHSETALILFTSGSTGAPRAVQLSRANVEANLRAVLASLDFQAAREQVLFLPLSYAFGLLGQLLPGLVAGTRTRLVGNLVELKSLAESGELRGMVSGVPSHYETLPRLLGSASFPEVSHVVSAGAPLSVPLRQRLQEFFPRARLYTNYGQTELSPRALCLRSDHPAFFSSATGYPVEGLSVKLTDSGELCFRGDQVMLGYLGDEAATAERLHDGWLHTGDFARLAPDGLVTVLGRNDELLKVGGERIGPSELEAALRSLPGIEDAAVLGQADALYGTTLVALLVPRPDAAPGRARDLKLALRELLSPHKIPSRYLTVERLPRNVNGKLQRHLLAELLETGRPLA